MREPDVEFPNSSIEMTRDCAVAIPGEINKTNPNVKKTVRFNCLQMFVIRIFLEKAMPQSYYRRTGGV